MQHRHEDSAHHHSWSALNPPVRHLQEGERVWASAPDVLNNQVRPGSSEAVFSALRPGGSYPLAGPFFIDGAMPGDSLVVTVHDVKTSTRGWAGIVPGEGLLTQDFPNPFLMHFDLTQPTIDFRPGIVLTKSPFAGVMGVSPDSDIPLAVGPPHSGGGNIDVKDLRAGSTILFPVYVPGALFSFGDGHAVQGAGEVCGTALECGITVELSFRVIKGAHQAGFTVSALVNPPDPNPYGLIFQVTVSNTDTLTATRDSVSRSIDWLLSVSNLSPDESYVLLSLAADLHLSQVVNEPMRSVTTRIPLSIFSEPLGDFIGDSVITQRRKYQ